MVTKVIVRESLVYIPKVLHYLLFFKSTWDCIGNINPILKVNKYLHIHNSNGWIQTYGVNERDAVFWWGFLNSPRFEWRSFWGLDPKISNMLWKDKSVGWFLFPNKTNNDDTTCRFYISQWRLPYLIFFYVFHVCSGTKLCFHNGSLNFTQLHN